MGTLVPYTELCMRRSKHGFSAPAQAETCWTWGLAPENVAVQASGLYTNAAWDEKFEAMVDAMDGTSDER